MRERTKRPNDFFRLERLDWTRLLESRPISLESVLSLNASRFILISDSEVARTNSYLRPTSDCVVNEKKLTLCVCIQVPPLFPHSYN